MLQPILGFTESDSGLFCEVFLIIWTIYHLHFFFLLNAIFLLYDSFSISVIYPVYYVRTFHIV